MFVQCGVWCNNFGKYKVAISDFLWLNEYSTHINVFERMFVLLTPLSSCRGLSLNVSRITPFAHFFNLSRFDICHTFNIRCNIYDVVWWVQSTSVLASKIWFILQRSSTQDPWHNHASKVAVFRKKWWTTSHYWPHMIRTSNIIGGWLPDSLKIHMCISVGAKWPYYFHCIIRTSVVLQSISVVGYKKCLCF